MRVSEITAKNFIGARDVDLKLSRPVLLVCGKNHSGKSSVAQAVRMALTGEPSRVFLKKEYKQLVSDDSEVGYAVVENDGGQSAITIPNGAHEQTGSVRPSELLPFVLDAQRFASLDANERRMVLFALTGISITGPEVVSRMLERGCDADKVDIIAPNLRAGSDAAHKEAQAKARDAKAAWRVVTGETYGGVKAASWRANAPAPAGANKLPETRDALSRLDQQIEANAGKLGDMTGRAKRAAEQAGRLAELRSKAAGYARIADKINRDEADLKQWEAKLEEVGKSSGQRLPEEPTYTCPSCSAVLRHSHANGALVEYTPPPPVDREAADKLLEYQKAAELMRRCVENGKRDLGAADAAAKALAEIDAGLAEVPNTGEMDTLKAATDDLKQQRAELQKAIRQLEDAERAAHQADKRTADAAKHHGDVQQWETIASALAPDGIPGQMLGEALGPVNGRLVDSAFSTGWMNVAITSDMDITADGRAYALLSESERWRVDAMIAETIANLSGEKLLVLDRVDVLDIGGREDLLFWLDDMTSSGQIETALLFATLKALPANLPDNIEAVWIENGRATTAGKLKAA